MIKTLENKKKNPFLVVLALDVLKTSKLSHMNLMQKLIITATTIMVSLQGASALGQKRSKSIFCANELQATAMNAPAK